MIIIGAGRVGTALFERAKERGIDCDLVTRDTGWDALDGRGGAPILLTVRAEQLDAVVPRVPQHRRSDLVFVQNGAIRTWLIDQGLRTATRGLLFFAVGERGGSIRDGGTSVFCGTHATGAGGFLVELDLDAAVVDWPRFSVSEVEKLVWNAAFGVLCEHNACDVGAVVEQHHAELRSLVVELSRVCRAAWGVDIGLDWLVDRLCRYALSIREWRASVKEYPWRNGWFVAQAERFGVPTPVHHLLLESTGHLPAT